MFITFEGINGCGKSTQASLLFEYLVKNCYKSILTKEPGGGGDFCVSIRKLLCQTNDISELTEVFLLLAARNEHIKKTIIPALNENKIVVCDRYIDSTFAYQCYDNDSDKIDIVKKLHKKIGVIIPDITFYIDISVEESEYRLAPLILENVERGSEGYKKYDELASEKMQKILNTYRKIAKEDGRRIMIIDGTKSKEEIHKQIIDSVEKMLKQM